MRISNELSRRQREAVVRTHKEWPKTVNRTELLELLDKLAKEIVKIEKEEE